MPYDNNYNRMVADDVMKLNQKYIEHDRRTTGGPIMSGGFLGSLAGMLMPSIISGVSSLFGDGMSGGAFDDVAFSQFGDDSKTGGRMPPMSGFAEGTFRDTGFDRVIGAGLSAGVAKYNKKASYNLVGKGELGLREKIIKEGLTNRVGGVRLFKKKKATLGERVPVANMHSSSMAGGGSSVEGEGVSGGFIDFSGVMAPVDKFIGDLAIGMMKKKKGKGRSGAGITAAGRSGAGITAAGRSGAGMTAAGRSGAGRSGAGRSGAGRSGAGRSGAGMCGGGKAERAALVKKIMNERGLSMIEASKYVKTHNLYKKKN